MDGFFLAAVLAWCCAGTVPALPAPNGGVAEAPEAGEGLMKLRPVTYHYKPEFDDGSQVLQYGLIAEEVARVFPEMVELDREGRPRAVRYHLLAPLLRDELARQRREAARRRDEIDDLRRQVEALRARVSAVDEARAARAARGKPAE
jgi:hypothetical protein